MYEEHQEGAVRFLSPPIPKIPTADMPVFYNPQSELNRDTTILAIQAFSKRQNKTAMRVCTPLAGTGVRPIRIAKEVSGISKVIAGDTNPLAIELIEKNRRLNDVTNLVEVHHTDANQLLTRYISFQDKFDVVDIDPFGTPRDFFTSAINAIKPPGLLCLTATDMPVLVGIRQRTCIKRYAAVPLKTEYAHELAVRILFGCVVREAAAVDIGLKLLLSFSIDHYIRLFCEAIDGDEETWTAISKLGFLTHCPECGYRSFTQGLTPSNAQCPNCQTTTIQKAGPLWIDQLGDREFVDQINAQSVTHDLGTKRRLKLLLTTISQELEGPSTYYDLHRLADKLNIPIPPFRLVINTLRAAGEFCTRTHFSPYAIRTSANEDTISNVLLTLRKETERNG